MESNFSDRVKDVISYSREEALRLGHDYIGPEHLLLGLIREGEGKAIKIMVQLGVDLNKLRKSIENAIKGTITVINLNNLPLTRQAEKPNSTTAP
jgi:ATP-dependent Clp protease ATP-binding subunit ClpC